MSKNYLVDLTAGRHRHSVLMACSSGTVTTPLRHALSTLGFAKIDSKSSFAFALEASNEKDYTLIFFDSEVPEDTGISVADFLKTFAEKHSTTFMIAVSTAPTAENIFRTIRAGARGYLVPPFAPDLIDEVILQATEGPQIDEKILNAPDRNLALAKMLLDHLDRLSAYIKSIEAQIMEDDEPDLQKILMIDRLSVVLTEGVRASKMFAEGGEDQLLQAIVKECTTRAMGSTRLGQARKDIRRQRLSDRLSKRAADKISDT